MVQLRRNFNIQKGQLKRITDSFDLRASGKTFSLATDGAEARRNAAPVAESPSREPDSLLMEAISGRTGGPMFDVVPTIQAEQDSIIRLPAFSDVFLQGVAGSGKTVIALHRMAYLLFAGTPGHVDRKRVLVSGPTEAFLSFVENVLPLLG